MNPVTRFQSVAKAYAAFRPSYPAGAIDAVLEGLGNPNLLTVADVGAGTGIAARLFAKRGATVIAVEPNAHMRVQARHHAHVRWCEGTAERTGLQTGSVDVVAVCQAFHWFAADAAMREFRRIARRRAALLQYERDEAEPFTAAYGAIVRSYATDDTEGLRTRALDAFAMFPDACVRRTSVASRQKLDRAGLTGRAASASYLPQSGPRAEALRRDLDALFERFASGGLVELAIVTFVLIADW